MFTKDPLVLEEEVLSRFLNNINELNNTTEFIIFWRLEILAFLGLKVGSTYNRN